MGGKAKKASTHDWKKGNRGGRQGPRIKKHDGASKNNPMRENKREAKWGKR